MNLLTNICRSLTICAVFLVGCGFLEDIHPAEAETELDTYILNAMEESHIPGLGVAVVSQGEIVWTSGYGWANIEDELAVTPDTLFMLASVSKTVTATALMQLYEQGEFGLDDDINNHLPFTVRNPHSPSTPITFRMLLTHTSSIIDSDTILDLYSVGDSPILLGDFVRGYFTEGGTYYSASNNFDRDTPGTYWEYSNMGATLAGYLVEVIANQGFSEYCDEHIFQPLSMNETSWFIDGLDKTHVARPYQWSMALGYEAYEHYGYPDYPDGQLRTSVNQLARFLAAFMNDGTYGGAQILHPSTVQEMHRRQASGLDPDQGIIWFYGDLGEQGEVFGHNGGDDGVSTMMFYRPSDELGVILLSNGEPEVVDDALEEIFLRVLEEYAQ